MSRGSASDYKKDDDDDDVPLPGFRFHPTDEELVGFYLRRMIDKKPLRIQLIKHVDVYKYEPWDLPKSGKAGDKECYFFCKRERKYKNSVRPNRVTGSGFWKATGIDRPIYSSTGGQEGENRECIGLKKSLIYYCGKAGKGTKTDWMMHEYRLLDDHDRVHPKIITKRIHLKNIVDQEAEVWTLCRILKRNRKYVPDWRELDCKRNPVDDDESSKTCCTSVVEINERREYYASSSEAPTNNQQNEMKQFVNHVGETNKMISVGQQLSSIISETPPASSSLSGPPRVNEFTRYGDWDELTPVVEFAFNPLLW